MPYRQYGNLYLPDPPRNVRASYNAASRSRDAARNFAGTDFLSADSAMTQEVRRLVSARARNEFANNSFAYGIVSTLADDTVGRGPRLQLHVVEEDEGGDPSLAGDLKLQAREHRFHVWAKAVGLVSLLRCARIAKAVDGEVFVRLASNPAARREITLQPELCEPELVASADPFSAASYYDSGVSVEVDGIVYDRYGNPVSYTFWRVHPGTVAGVSPSDHFQVPASQVLHYANIFRPGQHRGISEMLAALHVFNDLRRFSTAVVLAAEVAARLSFIISNDLPPELFDAYNTDPDTGEVDGLALHPASPLANGDFNSLVLPAGYKASQMRPEHPTQTYVEFRNSKINEAARVFSMPFNVAAGDSSSYNYASGRLDHQVYNKRLLIERDAIETVVLDPILAAWEELDRLLHPADYEGTAAVSSHGWMWDGFEHVDPVKEANAQASRLTNGVTTLEEECAREGRDYLTLLRQRQREFQLCRQKGIPPFPWMNAESVAFAPDGSTATEKE